MDSSVSPKKMNKTLNAISRKKNVNLWLVQQFVGLDLKNLILYFFMTFFLNILYYSKIRMIFVVFIFIKFIFLNIQNFNANKILPYHFFSFFHHFIFL